MTDASILVYKQSPERAGLNMYAENTQQQITFLALLPCSDSSILVYKYRRDRTDFMKYAENTQPQLIPCIITLCILVATRAAWSTALHPVLCTLQTCSTF